MNFVIKNIDKKDYKRAIDLAVKGMHFNWYFKNDFLLYAYGKYFWYLELNEATQILAAYVDDKFVGVLLARFNNEKNMHNNFFEKAYVKVIDFIQNSFFKNSAGLYEETCEKQLNHYLLNNDPDGEIVFLAGDSNYKGVGTTLLHELENREKGKVVYLYTDDACTYEFYEHRGFIKNEENNITLKTEKGEVILNCFLYCKKIK